MKNENSSSTTLDRLIKMEIHDYTIVSGLNILVLRVPGGLIYSPAQQNNKYGPASAGVFVSLELSSMPW